MPKTKNLWLSTLTNEVDCEWCGAEAGKPCKIELSAEDKRHHTYPAETYRLGNDKTYFPNGEMLHLCRSKKIDKKV